ncbi:MAG: hypothetical protein HLUCCO17_05710 [Saliniramus fredricksonii]|uniref:Uncharacterized protein n=1 Tax=Saliniramus fredricksonii TaxID=1653334 RepID=A0A0N8KEL6_9HYPH|nr:MAG: hypothetical protein HLUCCO17_05710 [Saliniramus fredricksonii]SCC80244.1 hypothetical protein GA0071312_1379 [Saliniramus fredricksonii]
MQGDEMSADARREGVDSRPSGLPTQLRRAGFVGIALFILLAPSAGQVFGVKHLLLREWVMYSGVGVGIPRGEFRIWRGDHMVATLSPLEALDLPAYPSVIHYTFAHRVLDDADLPAFAARLCEALADHDGDRVSFEGVVGTRAGWRRAQHGDVCKGDGHQITAAGSQREAEHDR